MTDIPIIFSAPMILGLDREAAERGTGKSMTSRNAWRPDGFTKSGTARIGAPSHWQSARVGDRLWVRESLTYKLGMWWYAADDARVALEPQHVAAGTAWAHHYSRDSAPSIHMPRAISRFTLVVTGTKIRRLQEITEAECVAEGAKIEGYTGGPVDTGPMVRMGPSHVYGTPRTWFRELWDSLHGAGAWDGNPEVVALRFTVHKQNIDSLKQAT